MAANFLLWPIPASEMNNNSALDPTRDQNRAIKRRQTKSQRPECQWFILTPRYGDAEMSHWHSGLFLLFARHY